MNALSPLGMVSEFPSSNQTHTTPPGAAEERQDYFVEKDGVKFAGTHLLIELARAFGYLPGEEAPANPIAGAWHYLEFTNSHTAAPDFFIDTVRRQPHGNRAHPFPHHPSLFIYRNPLDIVTSEANYYQEDGSTVFAGYLDALDYDQRLLRLIDDPWLMGSVRDRVGKFAAWLEFGSVIPVSFDANSRLLPVKMMIR